MSSLNLLLGTVLAIFALAGILGGTIAIIKASYIREQLTGLRGDRDDLRARVDFLEKENTRVTGELLAAEEKVSVLKDIVIGKEHLEKIEQALSAHLADTTSQNSRIFTALEELIDGVSSLQSNRGGRVDGST